ncbi:MAG: ABC transporter substrate-binding protein [Chloroflexota bacterium]|nr:ABC transporter substrate-binding protein [Chloroflexota bacterium]
MKLKQLWSMVGLVALLATTAFVPSGAAQSDAERADTFRIAIGARIEDPTNLNLYAPGVSRSDTGLHQLIYEYFFYYNLQTGEFVPWLAESFEYNDAFDSLTVILRDGVTWSDGEVFNADDVVFTYDLLRENPSMIWASEANNRVTSVEKVDDLTVTFNLVEANPRFHLNREAFPAVGIWGGITILPQHVWEGEDPLTFLSSDPIGTGAYRLADASQTAMTYERRDDWWGSTVFPEASGPETIQFVNVGPETNIALALTANELDVSPIGVLSAGSFQEVTRRNPNVRAWATEAPFAWSDPCPRALMVQNATAPLDQPAVRWAISSLIDRQSVVDLSYEGTTVPAWGIWPEYDANLPYFDAIGDLREQYPSATYDPARAEELLAEAGVSPADITLRYIVNPDSAEEMKVSQVVADQLIAAGFNVEVQPMSGGAREDTIRRGDWDITMQAFCPGYIVENLELFHSKFYEPVGELAPWFERNSFRYQNPEFDAIVDEMFTVTPDDTEVLTALYAEAMEIWLADLPVIPLVQAPALVPFNSTYWQGWPTAEDPWNMPVSWWATFNLVVNGYPDPATGEWVGGLEPAD